MNTDTHGSMPPEAFNHPLLVNLSDLAAELTGIRFFVVFPVQNGWSHCYPGSAANQPDFCRLIQSTREGAQHCKMCHVLMSVAACPACIGWAEGTAGRRSGLTAQRCHAGLSVLVAPAPDTNSAEVFSVLSTCTFTSSAGKDGWQEAKARGKKLGIDLAQLKKTFEKIPSLDAAQEKIARALLKAAGEAVREIKTRILLQKEIIKTREHADQKSVLKSALEERFKNYHTNVSRERRWPGKPAKRKRMPVLIRVVEELVRSRPDIPYSVAEIASAARITPNHFSSLFHNYTGETFSEFLNEKRISAAKSLLRDLTLNISEVAFRVGYGDAGYFTRRFRQATGKSPRAWRANLSP